MIRLQASGFRLQEEGIGGVWNWDHSTGIEFGLGRTEFFWIPAKAGTRFVGIQKILRPARWADSIPDHNARVDAGPNG